MRNSFFALSLLLAAALLTGPLAQAHAAVPYESSPILSAVSSLDDTAAAVRDFLRRWGNEALASDMTPKEGRVHPSAEGSGCMVNPAAALSLEWVVLAIVPLIAAIRGRRK